MGDIENLLSTFFLRSAPAGRLAAPLKNRPEATGKLRAGRKPGGTIEGAPQEVENKRNGIWRVFMVARGPQVHLDRPEGLPHDEVAGGSNGFSCLLVGRRPIPTGPKPWPHGEKC
jgi:hypothetical protein